MWHIGDDPDVLLQSFLQAITNLILRLLTHFYRVHMNPEEKNLNALSGS